MAPENQSKPGNGKSASDNKKRKHRFLPTYKPMKKGSYPVRPGVQGFFITCDGGRERQASHEAMDVIESFYEELVHGKVSSVNVGMLPDKQISKKIKFTYADSGSDDDDNKDGNDASENGQKDKEEDNDTSVTNADDAGHKKSSTIGNSDPHEEVETRGHDKEDTAARKSEEVEGEEAVAKKEKALGGGNIISKKVVVKSVDKLIDEEIQELGDRSKRRFSNLDSGCNGVVFVQIRKIDADPSPTDIVQHMMTSLSSAGKHVSRFLLRVLPIEVTCYASEDEITKAIKPLISQHFPSENHSGHKFAVLYEARANTGIDRAKIINAVAKCVPAPHKVDLNSPDKNIVVQIVKTMCLIGVIEKYKELAKFNVRQLTSPKP